MTTHAAGKRTAITLLVAGLMLVGLAPAAGADGMERGREVWGHSATDDAFCGIVLARHVQGQSNWMERRNDAGELTYWQGTLNVTVDLANPENGRSVRLRSSGIDREVWVSEADQTLTVFAAGTGLWGTVGGQGKASGVAGLTTLIVIDDEVVGFDVRGSDDGDAAMCAYLAGA